MTADAEREKSIFLDAIAIVDRSERASFVTGVCGADSELRCRIDVLLAAYETPDSLFAAPFVEPPTAIPEPSYDPGLRIDDRYELVERIGEGGMGQVWKAKQIVPVERFVAIKLIRSRSRSQMFLERFNAERQVLARLEHPGIARVFDGGTTSDGSPYFAMELVAGVPVTRYADDRRLDLTGRIDLFVQVCRAVEHAHRRGIIHCDLKPSNILVAEFEGRAVPKVIDFGVARATDPRDDAESPGQSGRVVGTPSYMSPEQADPETEDLDPRTDVYSLGILLFELLVGELPKSVAAIRNGTTSGTAGASVAQDVPSPTTNLRLSGSLSDIADKRRTDPESLVRQMRGDLDAIVMKSIEASRDRRYQTPTELADDLLRSLRHEPVTARMATRSYRFRKFVRRNRAAVMFSAGLAVALLVGLAGTGIGYFRAQRALAEERIQRGIADGALQAESAQRLQAQADARAARTANEFLTDLFTHSDPILQVVKYGEIQSELRVRDLLKRAAESIPGRFESEPLTAATLHLMIGNGFYGIHDPKAAVEQFKLAESLYERSCGPEHLLTLTARVDLARTLGMSGQPADAEILLRDVLPRLRLLGDEADHVFRIGEMVLVHVLSQRGKTEEAEAMIARLLDLPSATTNRSAALQQIAALNQVANVLIASGKYPRAENLTEKALALATAHGFLPTPLGVQVRLNRSSVLRARGKLDEAEPILRAAIASSETINGPRHRDTVQALGNLTILLNARGRPEDLANAARVAGQIYGIAKEINGLKHFQTITAGINLGILEINRNASKGAIPVLREILGPARDLAGPRSIYATTILVALGRALTDVGEAGDAEPLLREAIAAMEKSIPGDWRIPQAECCLGRALVSQRKTADGVSLLEAGVRKLVERKDKMPKQDHSLIRIAVQWLIEAYRASGQSGKVAEAESAYREFLTQPK